MAIEAKEGEVPDESLVATLSDPPRYAKAIMAAVLAGAGACAVAADDGFSNPEVWGIIATTVTAFVGVFGVRNK